VGPRDSSVIAREWILETRRRVPPWPRACPIGAARRSRTHYPVAARRQRSQI